MAHVVAASYEGPRGDVDLPEAEISEISNIILLCPTCHLLIDKCPNDFPTEVIMSWKSRHEGRIKRLFALGSHASRAALRCEVEGYLRHNKAIFDAFGPLSVAAADPLSDAVDLWHREIVASVIPNNRKILELLDSHVDLPQPVLDGAQPFPSVMYM
jgi:hypothetical protein